jgi:hypothetical protein
MNQLKQIQSQLKKHKNESLKQKAKKITAKGEDLMFGISPKDQEYIAQALYQAIILNKKQGQRISLCVPILDIDKIDLESLMIAGTTCEALAKRTGERVSKHSSSLPDIYNHYGMVYLVTENHQMLNTTLEVKEVEKEVIKEVKTIQTKATGIKEKDIIKAIENTRHKMRKEWQFDVVEAVLDEFKKQINV